MTGLSLRNRNTEPRSRSEESRKKPKFYWDVVFKDTMERPGSSRQKMTRSRAKSVLNVGEDDRVTTRRVYRAFRKLSYPLELEDKRDKNRDGFSLVDLHEAFQQLMKNARSPTDSDEERDKEENEAIEEMLATGGS